MRKLGKYVSDISEGRTIKADSDVTVKSTEQDVTFDGAEEKGAVELNPKADDSVMKFAAPEFEDEEEMGRNERLVQSYLERKQPFFILGHAGWAKSSIVKRVAKRLGYERIVVNLDKACREDLGGMPVPTKDAKGRDRVKYLPMPWMDPIFDEPDKMFLLFFDEMNQADPDVMNALMPIVQDHVLCGHELTNYVAVGAGNYKDENKATHALSTPLMSRFKPIIIWEDNNEKAWDDTFKYYHKVYDSVLGQDFIDKWRRYTPLFMCPRELNEKIWDQFIEVKKSGLASRKRYKPEYIAEYISGGENSEIDGVSLFKKDVDSRDKKKYANEMAEIIYEWLQKDENSDSAVTKKQGRAPRGSEKTSTTLDEVTRKLIKSGMKLGYIDGDAYGQKDVLYAVSEENIYNVFDPKEVPAESLAQYIKHLKADGIEFKYKTTQEAINDMSRTRKTAKVVDAASV